MDSCLPQERISTTCTISALRNDIKRKYIFMYPKINSAQHGLILHETSSFPMTIITLLSPLPDRRPFHFPNLLLCIDKHHSAVLTSLSSLPICLVLHQAIKLCPNIKWLIPYSINTVPGSPIRDCCCLMNSCRRGSGTKFNYWWGTLDGCQFWNSCLHWGRAQMIWEVGRKTS